MTVLIRLAPRAVVLTGNKQAVDTPLSGEGWVVSGNGFLVPEGSGQWVLSVINDTPLKSWRDGVNTSTATTFVTQQGRRVFVQFADSVDDGSPVSVLAIPC